jgi:exo-beta-1,3-glucanase (GH17 family)
LSGAEKYISIGNEVDAYLQARPDEWATYTRFYQDAVSYLHGNSPGLTVGVTTTFAGFSAASTTAVRTLNASSDVIILTYYPLQGDAQVLPASSPATDIPRMLSLAGGKPVILQEAGYPSGAPNASSEASQQQFVSELFQAWHGAGNSLPFVSYFLLYDFDPPTCSALGTYYGSADPAFLSYLCTLGLRHSDGTAKPAWSTFVTAAQ